MEHLWIGRPFRVTDEKSSRTSSKTSRKQRTSAERRSTDSESGSVFSARLAWGDFRLWGMSNTRCQIFPGHANFPAVGLGHSIRTPKKQKLPSPDATGRGKLSGMETITRQVGEMQAHERSAAELLLGHRLRGHEQLILQVLELDVTEPPKEDSRPAQTIEDWIHVYDGLSDEEIEKIDAIANTRANLTRDLP